MASGGCTTVNENDLVALLCCASTAVTTKLKVPLPFAGGVPEIDPDDARFRPGGRPVWEDQDQVTGELPPDELSCWL